MRERARFDVNLSILFTELDLWDRPAAAKAAGFDAVEFWWPFTSASPADGEVDRFVSAVADAGVALVALNFFAGDMPAGERGVLAHPGRETEFRNSVDLAVEIGGRLGCRRFNALYGNRLDDVDPSEQDALALENLTNAARAVASIDGTVLVEPVSGTPSYPLKTAADALSVLDAVRMPNTGLLLDLYHLTVNGDDAAAVIVEHTSRVGHVQIADSPGRHEPGTGEIDFASHLGGLDERGYAGHIGLEYQPSGRTTDSFDWLRSMA